MKSISHLAAQLLRDGRRTIAEEICALIDSSSSKSLTVAHSTLRTRLTRQVESDIHVLAACIEFSSQLMLEDYFTWVANLPESVSPKGYDVAGVLRQLNKIVDQRFPSEAARVVTDQIAIAADSLEKQQVEEHAEEVNDELRQLRREYLDSLLGKRRDDALRLIIRAIDDGTEIETIYLEVIQPTQEKLGRLWQAGKINVAQEHYCTAATQFVMSQLQPYFISSKSDARTLVATCVGDELHEVGLRILTDLFELSGWNTIYLGSNVPPESIAETLVCSQAEILAVSTTMAQHLFGLADVVSAVRSQPDCRDVKIMVGGYPFNVDPFLWKRVGADADASDGKDAIQVANRLVKQNPVQDVATTTTQSVLDASIPDAASGSVDDVSRMNNNLITLHRKLHKAHVDLAGLNKANEEKAIALKRADRRKDEFLAMLAHELRGPLAPMGLALTLLERDDADASMVEEARKTLRRQLHQLTHLVNDLLDASRIAHDKIELKKKTLDLANVIDRSIEIVNPLIIEKSQQLKLELSDLPIVIFGDEIRLAQIFSNLLTNASKYTSEHGTIWLTTKQIGDEVFVEVRDDGIGIDPDLLPDVFSAFAQEQRSRQYSLGGLGLGLSLVKQLVERHDGIVTAESDGVDQGSCFTVKLPAIESTEIGDSSSSVGVEEPDEPIPSRRVLVVEDTAGIARMTAILLEKLGHLPAIALDGSTAIEKYKEIRPEIVVLDLTLPDISGLEVTKEIRRIDMNDETLIVALTGHSDQKTRRLAKQSGCDEFLVKPIDIRDLKKLATHPKLMTTNDFR